MGGDSCWRRGSFFNVGQFAPHLPSATGSEWCQIAWRPADSDSRRRRRESVFNVGQNAPDPPSAAGAERGQFSWWPVLPREFVYHFYPACSLFCFLVFSPVLFSPSPLHPAASFCEADGEDSILFSMLFSVMFSVLFQFYNSQFSGFPRSRVSAFLVCTFRCSHIETFPDSWIRLPHPPSATGAELCQIAWGPAGGDSRRRRDSVFNVGQNAQGPLSAGRRRALSVCLGAGFAGGICFLFPPRMF